jgi:diadenylate cyclase
MKIMGQFFYVIKETFLSLINTGNIVIDLIDIALVAVFVYYGIKLIREIRAFQLLKGIFFLLVAYAVAAMIGLNTVTYIMKVVFDLGAVALLVVFQPELRRFLEKMGTGSISPFKNLFSLGKISEQEHREWDQCLRILCDSVSALSLSKTGALIVIERKSRLGVEIEKGGTVIDAKVSPELLGTIFYEGSPLHDGAVIIRDAKAHAAGCFLPMPVHSEHIPKKLGSRHRAAIGMSESSDAVVVIVSEETGVISTACNGNLTRNYTKASLFSYLKDEILPREEEKIDKKSIIKRMLRK